MPTLGAPLDFAKLEARNLQAHQLGAAPSSPVKGQLYFNTADNTLWWWDGSAWVSARGGASATPPATTIALGTIQLAGDLTGTATSPQIAAGAVTDAEVAAANKDGAVGTAGMRTLGAGAQQAMPGNRTLDAITPPVANLNVNNHKVIGVTDPTVGSDAANKNYVDNTAAGLDAKPSVKAASTGNIASLLGGMPNTLDGVALALYDRVLIKDQTNQTQNGIYDVVSVGTGSNGVLQRSAGSETWPQLPGSYVWVEQGTVYADTGWVCTSDQGGTLGTTPITWVQFSGAAQITAGAGLTKNGNVIDAGAGPGITVNPDTIQVANNGITNAMLADGAVDLSTADVTGTLPIGKGGTGTTTGMAANGAGYYSTATHGAGTTIAIPKATHGLRASRGLLVQVQDEATGNVELPDVSIATSGDVTVTYAVAVAANAKRVTVIG